MKNKPAITLFSLLLLSSLSFGASSQGPLTAGLGSQDSSNGGTVTWVNPSYITGACDGQSATATFTTGNPNSYYLTANSFGHTIPTGSTLVGFVIIWTYAYSGSSGVIDNGGVWLSCDATPLEGTNKSNGIAWTSSLTAISYPASSTSDLWGLSCAVADVNSNNYMAFLAAIANNPNGRVANVDCVTSTVYYTPPPSNNRGHAIVGFLFGHRKPKMLSQTSYAHNITAVPNPDELLFGREFQLGF